MSTQYPNAIDSYSTHQDNANEKISASVLNNIQDAIVALQNKLGVSGLTSMPPVGPPDSLCIVNHQLFISNGMSWNPVTLMGTDAVEVQLTSTSATTVASYTPKSNGNFLVMVYFRVTGGSSVNVTVQTIYTDATGTQTNTQLNAQSCAPNSYSLIPLFINAKTTGPITVSVTAGTANVVYASASVVGV
jgi:hypothetical protein